MANKVIETADLWFCEGGSDKVYHASVVEEGSGYVVEFSYGRRGGHMNTGKKTVKPVSLYEAREVFCTLVQSKVKKGYQYT
jgi:predicted DNA-binding WGR domain protein